MFRRLSIAVLVMTAVVVGSAGTAHAAKPAAINSSIQLNQTNPGLGDVVNFTVTFPRTNRNPRIDIYCYQNGVLGWATAGAWSESFKLGSDSSAWQRGGGAANCVANLYVWVDTRLLPQTYIVLASTSFDATG